MQAGSFLPGSVYEIFMDKTAIFASSYLLDFWQVLPENH
jgi:hypothetical protein